MHHAVVFPSPRALISIARGPVAPDDAALERTAEAVETATRHAPGEGY